ncbi:MAG: alanine--tRNA ligase [Phycisphaerae bacterium]|nr:alanine--tRNA ligase [Phycisphaerae bacterium]
MSNCGSGCGYPLVHQEVSIVSTSSARDIRNSFVRFFTEKAGHTFVNSSPVVPMDDPTLLFTNAGMNQFKDVFLGQGSRPYSRAVNSQKCIRAGGKHNDLEDVGKDSYHHTFFEMLGNWSFGDYFKKEAIEWAWEMLTEVYGIDPQRLYATYFKGAPEQQLEMDEEARDLWLTFLPPERVIGCGMKDNFWEMGETGPCGPCSEIHYDRVGGRDASDLVNADDPDVLEIWNLVFIQFNRETDGTLKPLPARHVDTGMGFERLVSILQNKRSNYDTDLWSPLFEAISQATGARPYQGRMDDPVDTAYRVIADHVRCLTVAITDGAVPSNEGRGYVLRRILRRAARQGHQVLQMQDPFLHALVPAVIDSLGDAHEELREHSGRVAEVIKEEEESFGRTIDRGLQLFAEAAERAGDSRMISPEDAFKLHDTYGFPIDLTSVMAEERGFTVDMAGYEDLMEQARQLSRRREQQDQRIELTPDAIEELAAGGAGPTDDSPKYDQADTVTAKVIAIRGLDGFRDQADGDGTLGLVLDRTCCYAEAGGQVGDTGSINSNDGAFQVRSTRKIGPYIMHEGSMSSGSIAMDSDVQVQRTGDRRNAIMANHSATHLLNHALRDVLGEQVEQRGSLVDESILRFDFSAPGPVEPEQLERIQSQVSVAIEEDQEIGAAEVPLEQAQAIHGVRAVFGERYPDPVRVVCIGAALNEVLAQPGNPQWRSSAIEFCGGTHLHRTSEAGRFMITSEQGIAAGVRRIVALTGPAAEEAIATSARISGMIEAAEACDDAELQDAWTSLWNLFESATIPLVDRQAQEPRIEAIRKRLKTVRKASASSNRDSVLEQARAIGQEHDGPTLVAILDEADKDSLAAAMDSLCAQEPGRATLLLSPDMDNGKVTILATVPDELVKSGLSAGEWVKKAAVACGGGGGGRPDRAQAGGKDPSRVEEAAEAARNHAREALG